MTRQINPNSTEGLTMLFQFWMLSQEDQRRIILKLGVVTEAELKLPESKYRSRALLRIQDRELLGEFSQEINQILNG